MLWFYLTLLLISCLQANQSVYSNHAEELIEKLRSLGQHKCRRNADENAYKEIENSAGNLKECISSALQSMHNPINEFEGYNMICTMFLPRLSNCIQNFWSKIEPCLDTDEGYLTDFMNSIFHLSRNKRCGRFLTETMAEIRGVKCRTPYGYIGPIVAQTCLPKLNVLNLLQNGEIENFVLNRNEFCTHVETLMKCGFEIINEECQDTIISKYIENNTLPNLDWCKKIV